MYFGLRIDDLHRLAYDVAEANNIEHSFNSVSQMAGKKWYYAFMRRHPKLSLTENQNPLDVRENGQQKVCVRGLTEQKVYDAKSLKEVDVDILLSTHADRHVVDISVTVCLFFCVSA